MSSILDSVFKLEIIKLKMVDLMTIKNNTTIPISISNNHSLFIPIIIAIVAIIAVLGFIYLRKKSKPLIENKIGLYISMFIFIILELAFVSAGTTSFNSKMDIQVGDCWNGKLITGAGETGLNGYTITWVKGCDSQDNIEGVGNKGETESNKVDSTPIASTTSPPDTQDDLNLFYGGKGDVNIFFYNESYFDFSQLMNYFQWIISEMGTEKPFNEFTYNGYYEEVKGSGNSIKRSNDVSIGLGDAYGHAGWGDPAINEVEFNQNLGLDRWHFLLFHELGHIYTKWGHTNDGSMMDANGGDGKFRDYQIDTIRSNLK